MNQALTGNREQANVTCTHPGPQIPNCKGSVLGKEITIKNFQNSMKVCFNEGVSHITAGKGISHIIAMPLPITSVFTSHDK